MEGGGWGGLKGGIGSVLGEGKGEHCIWVGLDLEVCGGGGEEGVSYKLTVVTKRDIYVLKYW